MATVLFSLAIFMLSFVGLSIGAMFGRPPVRGCGGKFSCGACSACRRSSDTGNGQ